MAPPPGSEVFGKKTSYWKGKLIRYDDAGNAHVKMTPGRGRPAKVPIGDILSDSCESAPAKSRTWWAVVLGIGGVLVVGVGHAIGGQVWHAIWPMIFR
jgi:hypothetical protein